MLPQFENHWIKPMTGVHKFPQQSYTYQWETPTQQFIPWHVYLHCPLPSWFPGCVGMLYIQRAPRAKTWKSSTGCTAMWHFQISPTATTTTRARMHAPVEWRGGISTQLCFILLRTKSSKRCQQEASGWENTLSRVIKAITICLERTFQSVSFTMRYPLRRATKAGKVQVVGGSQGRKETRGLTMWDEAIMWRASCNQGDSK